MSATSFAVRITCALSFLAVCAPVDAKPIADSPTSSVSRVENRTKDHTRDPGLFGDYWWANRFLSRRREIDSFRGKTVDVVMLGDSIMHFWEWKNASSWAKFTKGRTVLNLGYGGDKTQNVLWRIDHGELDGYTARCVVVMIGTNNNSVNDSDPEAVAAGIWKIVEEVRRHQPCAKVILHPIFPRGHSAESEKHAAARSRNCRTNARLKQLADSCNAVVWVDFNDKLVDESGWVPKTLMRDEIHPTSAGYEIWMRALAPHLATYAGTPRGDVAREIRVDAPTAVRDWDLVQRTWTNATEKIQKAIDDVFRVGGGRVVVGRGFYPVKGLRLRSRVTLYLESGAVLQASRSPEDFNILAHDAVEPVPGAVEGAKDVWVRPQHGRPRTFVRNALSPWNNAIIRILNAHDVAIIGERGSVIDGANGFDPNGEEGYRGVHGVSAFDSTNVVYRGFTIRHTGNWAIRNQRCADITCDGVTMLAGHDGFHARECVRVEVKDCFIHTGDDAVAGFANRDMAVRRCDLSSACSAFRLGGRDILVEDCYAHGPCEYVFRGSLSPQAKRDGLWDPAVVPGRHSMATFFLYFCDFTCPVPDQPGNIVVRNCRVENCARFIRYNFGGETWQHASPLADIRFENVKASGLWRPLALNGGEGTDKDVPLDFTMVDCSLGFSAPQPEVFSVANVRTLALTNVVVSGASAPLVRTWDGRPGLRLSGVSGAALEIADGKGKYKCPMR